MSDETSKPVEEHKHHHHPEVEVERIESVSSTTTPWSVRLVFGILGVVFLGAAIAAWEFRAFFEGHVAQSLPYIIIGLAVIGIGAIVESITTEIWLALIIGVAALAVTFLIVGRAQIYPAVDNGMFMVDRFTGAVQYCTPDGCKPLAEVKELPKPQPLPQTTPSDVPAAVTGALTAPQQQTPTSQEPAPAASQAPAVIPATSQAPAQQTKPSTANSGKH